MVYMFHLVLLISTTVSITTITVVLIFLHSISIVVGPSVESLSTGGAAAIGAGVFVLCGFAVVLLVVVIACRLFVKHRQSVPGKGVLDTSVVLELQPQQQEAEEPAEKQDLEAEGEP